MPAERLMVKYPFGDYEPGDRITDPDEMQRVSASHPDFVLRERLAEPTEAKAEAPAADAPAKRSRATVND